MKFNENLIRLRKEKGMSQEELGNKINVARQTISKWELQETTPEMDKLIELSELFNISVDELIGNNFYKQNNKQHNIKKEFEFISKTKIRAIPLVHINIGIGFSMKRAKGIIAIGNVAQGIIAIGGVAMGIISLGGLGLGLISLSGISIGLLLAIGGIAIGSLAIGGVAIGLLAIGGIAIGIYALGGCAIAKNIAYGDYATGYIAIGNHVKGTVEFLSRNANNKSEIKASILKHFPNTWKIILHIFS